MAKYLTNASGTVTEVATPTTSAGAGDSGKIPSLDAGGKLDSSFMPTGIAADTAAITASEALSAGDLVNVWNSTGAKVRKADASTAGKEAHGFVAASGNFVQRVGFATAATALNFYAGTPIVLA